MGTLSPIITDAFRLLRTDLHAHLCAAESLATKNDEWSCEDIDVARDLIPDLVVVIRGLLIEHEGTSVGDCRTCHAAWPCPVVTTIHALVKDPDREFVAILNRMIDEE